MYWHLKSRRIPAVLASSRGWRRRVSSTQCAVSSGYQRDWSACGSTAEGDSGLCIHDVIISKRRQHKRTAQGPSMIGYMDSGRDVSAISLASRGKSLPTAYEREKKERARERASEREVEHAMVPWHVTRVCTFTRHNFVVDNHHLFVDGAGVCRCGG